MTSKWFFPVLQSSSFSRAWAQLFAVWVLISQWVSIFSRMRQWVSLLSTTSISGFFWKRSVAIVSVISFSSALSRVISKKKRLPLPGVLSTWILPPINRTRSRAIANPKPVPPYCRVVELSSCENFSKREPIFSAAMPIPVSVTENSRVTVFPVSFLVAILNSTSPWLVNLMALPMRLINTWRILTGSPTRLPVISCSSEHSNSSFFSWALIASMRRVRWTISLSLKGT